MARAHINVADVRESARRRLPRLVFDFLEGGSEDERTLSANADAFARIRLRSRVFAGVDVRDSSTTVLGDELSMPLILGPAGLAKLAHPEGEVALARAAGEAGIIACLSVASSSSIEEVARAASGPLWFQVYRWRDMDLVGRLIDRARAADYTALIVTLDVPVVGRRERDLRNGFSARPRLSPRNLIDIGRRPRWLIDYLKGPPITFGSLLDEVQLGDGGTAPDSGTAKLAQYVNTELAYPAATWEDVARLRERWPGKFAVKGVMCAEDAELAVEAGVDGIVVSNHGGRQLDSLPGTAEVTREVVEAVGGRAEVMVDGGIRRGTDILKALGLGASAALIGRPWWYGLAAGGTEGVREVIELLRGEFDTAEALAGLRTIREATPEQLAGLIHGGP